MPYDRCHRYNMEGVNSCRMTGATATTVVQTTKWV